MAPGSSVPGACVGGGLCRASGTSFATATVSGIAGLLMSIDAGRGVKPSGERIRKALARILHPPVRHRGADGLDPPIRPPGRLTRHRRSHSACPPPPAIGRKPCRPAVSRTPRRHHARHRNRSRPPPVSTGLRLEARPPREPTPGKPVPARGSSSPPTAALAAEAARAAAPARRKSLSSSTPSAVFASAISQARRDTILRDINRGMKKDDPKPLNDETLLELFGDEPYQAQSVVWTLAAPRFRCTPSYLSGAFAAETYAWLVEEWSDRDVEFISLPGVLAGKITLYDGQVVDAVVPDLRGLFSWDTDTLHRGTQGRPEDGGPQRQRRQCWNAR